MRCNLVHMSGSSVVLRNSTVQLTIEDGRITSLVDVQLQYVFFLSSPSFTSWIPLLSFRRELMFPGQTGGLVIFDDRPNYWDAWGALLYYVHILRRPTHPRW